MLTSQDISSEGFKEIKFHHFRTRCSPLNEDVLGRLLNFSQNLEILEVSKMQKLKEEDRRILSSLVVNFIRGSSALKHLSLDEFSKKNCEPGQGIGILQNLCQQPGLELRHLNLGGNRNWWNKDTEGFDCLLALIG